MTTPLVSCLCPTYSRSPIGLLEEAIESFLRQDYKHRELIVLNDHPEQELFCSVPQVVVINLPLRFKSLGDKYNAMVGMASGDLLCPWEDDDLSLPWRISLSVKMITSARADYYTPKRYWFNDRGRYWHDHSMGVGHSCSIYTRDAWRAVRGYQSISGAQDSAIDSALAATVKSVGCPEFKGTELPIEHWFYIMRWGTCSYHLSGAPNHDKFYNDLAKKKVPSGAFVLRPSWQHDYVDVTRQVLGAR